MKPDNKQLPQLIALGVLLLVCIGYVGIKVTSKPAPPPAQPAQSTTAEASGAEITKDAKNADGKAEANLDPKQLENVNLLNLPPVQKRDPFAPRLVAELPRPNYSQPSTQHRPVRNISLPSLPPPTFGSSFHVEPVKPTFAGFGETGTSGATPTPVASEPAFKVTGIIRGSQNVAIIRANEERHIVREGQWINGTYKVVSVTEDGVVMVSGNRRISLKLGGDKNAS